MTGDENIEKHDVYTAMRGHSLLETPLANKGVAFSERERLELGLLGLLPNGVASLHKQLDWAYAAYQRQVTQVDKHIFLRNLQDNNEALFYRLVYTHIVDMAPIIYTPVIGAICQDFSHHFRRPRGLFISYPDRERIGEILDNWPHDDVQVVVATDGERVLGLGDQGVGGMGIAIGKLALYTLCGGIHPATTLPILLDVGTDNQQLLEDPFYLGWRHERVRGDEYDAFLDAFVQALFKRFPKTLLQWEDFAKANARPLLERYRKQHCSFNDDIQGTAAVALAGLIAAVKTSNTRLSDQQIVIVGAGSAGVGIADLVVRAMREEGLSEQEAVDRIWVFNSKGLVNVSQTGLDDTVMRYNKGSEILEKYGLAADSPNLLQSVVASVHPTALIGVSGQPGIFSEGIVREMTKNVARPIIFPLSNPTSHSEADPEDLMLWTQGRALIGTGSPYPVVKYAGKEIPITQCNNSLVFPGLGLGIVSAKSCCVDTDMLVAAARALAAMSPAANGEGYELLPGLDASRNVAKLIAIAVGKAAQAEGRAPESSPEDLERRISANMWFPEYPRVHSMMAP